MRKIEEPPPSKLREPEPALATASNAPSDGAGTLEQRMSREVRTLRTRLGMTGAEVARASGVSTGMLSKIETGQISASPGILEAIAGVLNVSLASPRQAETCAWQPEPVNSANGLGMKMARIPCRSAMVRTMYLKKTCRVVLVEGIMRKGDPIWLM